MTINRRKKILWLCSWYPGKTSPFNGDFVQRHAIAVSLYADVHVIHVMEDATGVIAKREEEYRILDHLTEHIIYLKRSTLPIQQFSSGYGVRAAYIRAVRQYIDKNGVPDAVHVHVPVKAGLAALWLKEKYGVPFFITEHWGIYNDYGNDNLATKSILFRYFTKKIVRASASQISVSRFIAEAINERVVKKEYVVVPNAVDTNLFYPAELPAHNIFRFVHVSNMVPLKNARGILRSFQQLIVINPDVELHMVGDTLPDIRDFARQLDLPQHSIVFHGEVTYPMVAKTMQQADCLILFSDIENSPCVIGEALCCGCTVIATEVGGIPELVDESNSFLVQPKDENALATAMQLMITNRDHYHRDEIASAAAKKFSYATVGKKINAAYALRENLQ